MANIQCKLLTIITESALESELPDALSTLGASGFTITDARGSGSRGIRDAGWSSNSNIRIEVVCSEEVASRIAETFREKYYDDFAMILYESDICVMRPDKFT